MEDQIVSIETAELAKQKEFEGRCYHIYCIGYGSLKKDKELMTNNAYDDYGDVIGVYTRTKIHKGQPHLALAPTQSLLQKWLREKHNLYVYPGICHSSGGNLRFQAIVKDMSDGLFVLYKSDRIYLTHEEALEKGLQEALKLI